MLYKNLSTSWELTNKETFVLSNFSQVGSGTGLLGCVSVSFRLVRTSGAAVTWHWASASNPGLSQECWKVPCWLQARSISSSADRTFTAPPYTWLQRPPEPLSRECRVGSTPPLPASVLLSCGSVFSLWADRNYGTPWRLPAAVEIFKINISLCCVLL